MTVRVQNITKAKSVSKTELTQQKKTDVNHNLLIIQLFFVNLELFSVLHKAMRIPSR